MKVRELPPPPTSEVEQEYCYAAKIVQQLRPLLPQALFGELNAHHKKEANGLWDLTNQGVRLEMGVAFCHCTVLSVRFSSKAVALSRRGDVRDVLAEATIVLNIVTEEVNKSEGIIAGFAPNGHITCVWNATHLVDHAAFTAVKTSRLIEKRLAGCKITSDLNIASGPAMVANSKVGSKKHVTFIGNVFEVGEKLVLLNEGHVARLVIDNETFKELPREFQRTCKPIAVIRERDEPAIIAVAADEDSVIKGEQWKQYNTAFTLYNNSMFSEALNEFRKYHLSFPQDDAAVWLIRNVLEKIPHVKRLLASKEQTA